MKLETISLGATVVLVVAVVGLLFGHSLFAHGAVLVGIQVAAALLMLWARVTFGWRSFHAAANPTEGGLVTRGPYRWVRLARACRASPRVAGSSPCAAR